MREDIQKLYAEAKERLAINEFTTNGPDKIIISLCEKLEKEASPQEKEMISQYLYQHMPRERTRMTVYLYSVILEMGHNPEIMEEFIRYVTDNKELDLYNKNFLFYQFTRMIFMNAEYETEAVLTAKWGLLEEIKSQIKAEITVPLKRIPKEELNKNMAVVITEQFLAIGHGPTKTARDRCVVLKRDMGKEVLLINTGEFGDFMGRGAMPLFRIANGNYSPDLCEVEMQQWQGITIPFFQYEQLLPNPEAEELLLRTITQLKPSVVVNIGGGSVFAGLVNELIPVLTVATTQSGLVTTLTDYQTVHGKIEEKWIRVLQNMGKPLSHMIEGKFTFSLREQTEVTSRQKEKLPREQFLLAVVGGRLDMEVTEEFLEMLEHVLSEKIGVVFIGGFKTFDTCAERHPKIKRYMYSLGSCEDVLSKLEICDLYVNPTRKGGATSAVEAMSKGKPVVSVSYGDVAGTIGEAFCCRDYAEMESCIKRYWQDAEFYEKRSKAALKLAEELLDTKTEFVRIIEEYEKRRNR